MIAALGLSLAVIPLWAFGGSLTILTVGAFLMQVGVQGAWGVIPVHLNELAADAARGLMPGWPTRWEFCWRRRRIPLSTRCAITWDTREPWRDLKLSPS